MSDEVIENSPGDIEQAVQVQEAQLPEAQHQPVKGPPGQIDLLLDVTVKVTASLGDVEMQVRDVLGLTSGSVVKLERQVGEPVDLYLRGVKFAIGNLVVVGEHLGVRIREILPPEQTQAAVQAPKT